MPTTTLPSTFFQLPVDLPCFDSTITLGGVSFGLRLDWNGREDRWYLSLYDAAGAAVVRGRKVTPNVDMLRGVSWDNAPPGVLCFLARVGTDAALEAPGFKDLGRTVKLCYFEGDIDEEIDAYNAEIVAAEAEDA